MNKTKKYDLFLIDVPELDKEFNTIVYYSTYNDGIGSYECHGYKGYDKGNDCVEVLDIQLEFDNSEDTQDDIFVAKKFLNDNFDKIEERVREEIEEYEYKNKYND